MGDKWCLCLMAWVKQEVSLRFFLMLFQWLHHCPTRSDGRSTSHFLLSWFGSTGAFRASQPGRTKEWKGLGGRGSKVRIKICVGHVRCTVSKKQHSLPPRSCDRFLQDSLGTQTRVVDSSQTKLQADTVTKATVGSWITHIFWYHFWSLCGFQKAQLCEEHPSEKSIQMGDSKQQDEEVAAEPVFA